MGLLNEHTKALLSSVLSCFWISGSRYEKLQKLNLPALVIHGKKDPFIPFAHGVKCASYIPDAYTLWLDNMGHDIPDHLVDTLSNRIIKNIGKGKIVD